MTPTPSANDNAARTIALTVAQRDVVIAALEMREHRQRRSAQACLGACDQPRARGWITLANETAAVIAIVKGETP